MPPPLAPARRRGPRAGRRGTGVNLRPPPRHRRRGRRGGGPVHRGPDDDPPVARPPDGVGTSCPGYTFDEAARSAQLDGFVALHEPKEGTDPGHYRSAAATVVGIHYGGGLVLAGQDYDVYCQHAEEEMAQEVEGAPTILVKG